MARKPSRRRPSKARPAPPPPAGGDRERIVHAFMQLLAEKRLERIDLSEVAKRASVSLARLREQFDSPFPFSQRIGSRSTARCSTAAMPIWRRSRRATGCSTC